MKAPKHSRPFNLEHSKAGAPYACRDGRKAEIVKWDLQGFGPLLGFIHCHESGEDIAVRWLDNGTTKGVQAGAGDLVMLPLGYIEGKPFFVGDRIVGNTGAEFEAMPSDKDGTHDTWRWPAPAKQHPKIINGGALNEAVWLFVAQLPGPIPGHIWNNVKMPLKAAIELWLTKQTEFDLRDSAARDLSIASAVIEAAAWRLEQGELHESVRQIRMLDLAAVIAKVSESA